MNRLIVRAIAVWQRRRARSQGVRNAQTGAVTFVQRFGGLLNLNVHYHLVVPDGVFVAEETSGELSVLELRGPTDDELLAVLDRVADRIATAVVDHPRHRTRPSVVCGVLAAHGGRDRGHRSRRAREVVSVRRPSRVRTGSARVDRRWSDLVSPEAAGA